ncbi:MAG TPA: hypothetical protein VMS64_16375, partial [Candidatus Methylomirabilis sp.]|nr:hypothetical protein [Candidatus Methylomirabilis sp.]
ESKRQEEEARPPILPRLGMRAIGSSPQSHGSSPGGVKRLGCAPAVPTPSASRRRFTLAYLAAKP